MWFVYSGDLSNRVAAHTFLAEEILHAANFYQLHDLKLMVEGRLPLTAAVRYVFERRPIILTNQSFVDQLVGLAAAEGLLS